MMGSPEAFSPEALIERESGGRVAVASGQTQSIGIGARSWPSDWYRGLRSLHAYTFAASRKCLLILDGPVDFHPCFLGADLRKLNTLVQATYTLVQGSEKVESWSANICSQYSFAYALSAGATPSSSSFSRFRLLGRKIC